MQDKDPAVEADSELEVVTKRAPSSSEVKAMVFANKIAKHTKSNAIVIATDSQMQSSGVGQTSRVDAVQQALHKATTFGSPLNESAMASDAFFPFKDGVELASEHGIKSIIQPGGSVRDQEVIDFCNQKNIAMVFTGKRHFKH